MYQTEICKQVSQLLHTRRQGCQRDFDISRQRSSPPIEKKNRKHVHIPPRTIYISYVFFLSFFLYIYILLNNIPLLFRYTYIFTFFRLFLSFFLFFFCFFVSPFNSFSLLLSYMHVRIHTRITPMRKIKILLSVLDCFLESFSQAVDQSTIHFVRGSCLCSSSSSYRIN